VTAGRMRRQRRRARRKRKRSPRRRKWKRRTRRRRSGRRRAVSDGRGEERKGNGGPQAKVLQERRESHIAGASELSEVRTGRVSRQTRGPRILRPMRIHGIREEMTHLRGR